MNKINNRKYDMVCSLGEACFTATVMKNYNIRSMSGPLDWMYGATFEERFHIFINKFQNFFNKEDLVLQGRDNTCDAYLNTKTKICFNHDFPYGVDFEKYYPVVANKYERRIKRLINKINKSKKVLILYIDLPNTDRGLKKNEKLFELMIQLHQTYPNTKFDILYIKHNQDLKENKINYNLLSENIIIAECYNKSTDPQAPDWVGNYENTICALDFVSLKHPVINRLKQKISKLLKKIKRKRGVNE